MRRLLDVTEQVVEAPPAPERDAQRPEHPEIFLSYARSDGEFVRRLVTALERRGKDVWVDWDDIRKSADWWPMVEAGIESARTVVAVISPEFAKSEWCAAEIRHARENEKRLIPIVRSSVSPERLDRELAAKDWIFFRDEDDFDASIAELVDAVEADQDWLDEHARLLRSAKQWERQSEDSSYLLRGAALKAADAWLGQQGGGSERPTPLQTRFIYESRQAATRRQRAAFATVGVVLLIVVVAAALAFWQRNVARRERDVAQSRAYAAESTGSLRDGDLQRSLLDAARAFDAARTTEARDALLAALKAAPNLITTRSTGRSHAAAFSADGRTAAVALDDGTIALWNLVSRSRERTLPRSGDPVTGLALSPSARLLAAGHDDGTVTLWNIRSGRSQTLKPGFAGRAIGEKPLGSSIAFAGDSILVWQLGHGEFAIWSGTGSTIRRVPTGSSFLDTEPRVLAVSPDGRLVALAMPDSGRLKFVARSAGDGIGLPSVLVPGGATSVVFVDSTTVAVGGRDGSVDFWDAEKNTRAQAPIRTTAGVISRLVLSTDGANLLVVGSKGVAQLSLISGRARGVTLPQYGDDLGAGYVGAAATVATAGANGTLAFWASSRPRLQIARLLASGETAIAFAPTGRLVAGAGTSVATWTIPAGVRLFRRPFPHFVGAVAVSRDGESLLVGDEVAGTTSRFDASRGTTIGVPVGPQPDRSTLRSAFAIGFRSGAPVSAVAPTVTARLNRLAGIGSFGSFALTTSPQSLVEPVHLWDLRKGTRLGALHGRTAEGVEAGSFSRGGDRLATLDAAGRLTVWAVDSRHAIRTFPHRVTAAAFTPDASELVVAAKGGGLAVWDFGSRARPPRGIRDSNGSWSALDVAADGRLVAGVGTDGRVALWDARKRSRVGTVDVYDGATQGGVPAVALSPDGRSLVATDSEGTLRLFSLDPSAWAKRACRLAGRAPDGCRR